MQNVTKENLESGSFDKKTYIETLQKVIISCMTDLGDTDGLVKELNAIKTFKTKEIDYSFVVNTSENIIQVKI